MLDKKQLSEFNSEYKNTMIGHLGIEFLPSENDEVIASMPVDERTSQSFGFLHGGASVALAESIAGHGSRIVCEDGEYPCGIQVSANHIAALPIGETVIGKGSLIQKGKNIHLWNVDLYSSSSKLISSIRITNYITRVKK